MWHDANIKQIFEYIRKLAEKEVEIDLIAVSLDQGKVRHRELSHCKF